MPPYSEHPRVRLKAVRRMIDTITRDTPDSVTYTTLKALAVVLMRLDEIEAKLDKALANV